VLLEGERNLSILLTNSFAYVRLPSELALSSLAESDQITGTNIEMPRYTLTPRELQITIQARAAALFISRSTRPPWQRMCSFLYRRIDPDK
jgi:hypothetical protein